jgi:hypothetical protein
MDSLCRSCQQALPKAARVCPNCGSPQSTLARLSAALKWAGAIATVVSLLLGVSSLIGLSQNSLEKREAVEEISAAADQLRDDGDYARAWQLYDQAAALDPGSRRVRRGQEQLAQRWLPHVHITGNETFTDIVNLTLPVLMRALVNAKGEEAADIQALVGWAHYLEQRERPVRDANVPGLYRRALQLDAGNAIANLFLGHWYISQEEDLDKGMMHFQRALDSGKHRALVRGYQWSALSNLKRSTSMGSEKHIALRRQQLRMMFEMLSNEEPWVTARSDSMPNETISAYGQPYRPAYDWFDAVLPTLTAEQHLQLLTAMMPLLGPSQSTQASAKFLLARLYEYAQQSKQALAIYQQLDDTLTATDNYREPVDQALERLTGTPGRYRLLREQPLLFHSQSLSRLRYSDKDFIRAVNYFTELPSDIQGSYEGDSIEPAIATLTQASLRLEQWLMPVTAEEQQRELVELYWKINEAKGKLLLHSRALPRSIDLYKQLASDDRLRTWMLIDANYQLACAYSLQSISVVSAEQTRTKQQAVAALLKSIKLGYEGWQHIKRDSDLDAIRDQAEYRRIMSGR